MAESATNNEALQKALQEALQEARKEARQEARQRELGKFLQAHRERVPGLPREDVAAASGLGLAWYTWLEQGRVPASHQVVDAVARTLHLDDNARQHILTLAGLHAPTSDDHHRGLVGQLRPVLDSWPTSPALLLDRRFDITAWNEPYAALWTDPGLVDERRRNLAYLLITSRLLGSMLREWETVTKDVLAQFRNRADHDPQDGRTREILALLAAERPDLRQWWESPPVHEFTTRTVTVNTATVGEIRLILSLFRPVDGPDSTLLLQTPASSTDQVRVRQLTELPTRWVGIDRKHGYYDH
ncbi:helix-turn-helix transcriptional regulator [Frankia sp. Cppng1_Ct_nod]|uniref:helix-turn-helix transcriptional regulator n=1 Tax=Frankia sp. Cppng1_Ct_nod TaxID=2897162 RepID=UPI0013EF6169|nr:helix-turn-helix transcriptional regulator [Frankia sp. Cppng1_Ct_nod]